MQVEYVVDGDSVRLSDGRSVRLIGINTPELKPRNRPPESLAIEARQAVVNFLAADGDILFYVDQGKRDRHGRYLGHLFRRDAAGLHSLERHLLLQGLAYHVAIPPNLSMAECFAIAEDTARVYGAWFVASGQFGGVTRGPPRRLSAGQRCGEERFAGQGLVDQSGGRFCRSYLPGESPIFRSVRRA